jgi:hypothetical protein
MAAIKDKAPGAVKILQRCNPLIKERIKIAIVGIQQTAEAICQITRGSGTEYEILGIEINKAARALSSDDDLKNYKCSARIASIITRFCRLLPQDKRGHACEIIEEIEIEEALSDRLGKIELALTYLQPNIEMTAYEYANKEKLAKIHKDIKSIDDKLNTIVFDLSQIKIGSGNVASNLWAVRHILNRIEIEQSVVQNSGRSSKGLFESNEQNERISQHVDIKVRELETILKEMPCREDINEILDRLESVRPSKTWEWVGRISDLIAIFDAAIKVVTLISLIKP